VEGISGSVGPLGEANMIGKEGTGRVVSVTPMFQDS
jgi:hypothetical protein